MERLLEMELVRQCARHWLDSKRQVSSALSFRLWSAPLLDQPDCHTAGEKEPFPRNAEL